MVAHRPVWDAGRDRGEGHVTTRAPRRARPRACANRRAAGGGRGRPCCAQAPATTASRRLPVSTTSAGRACSTDQARHRLGIGLGLRSARLAAAAHVRAAVRQEGEGRRHATGARLLAEFHRGGKARGEGRAAAAGQAREPPLGLDEGAGGGQEQFGPCATEGDQGHMVAPGVGLRPAAVRSRPCASASRARAAEPEASTVKISRRSERLLARFRRMSSGRRWRRRPRGHVASADRLPGCRGAQRGDEVDPGMPSSLPGRAGRGRPRRLPRLRARRCPTRRLRRRAARPAARRASRSGGRAVRTASSRMSSGRACVSSVLWLSSGWSRPGRRGGGGGRPRSSGAVYRRDGPASARRRVRGRSSPTVPRPPRRGEARAAASARRGARRLPMPHGGQRRQSAVSASRPSDGRRARPPRARQASTVAKRVGRRMPSRSTKNARRSARAGGASSSARHLRRARSGSGCAPSSAASRAARPGGQRSAMARTRTEGSARAGRAQRRGACRQASRRGRRRRSASIVGSPVQADHRRGRGSASERQKRSRTGPARARSQRPRRPSGSTARRRRSVARRRVVGAAAVLGQGSTSATVRATRVAEPASSSGSRRRRWRSAKGAMRRRWRG